MRLTRGKDALLLFAVVALASFAVFADEVLHGRWGADEVLVDCVVGVLLAGTSLLAALLVRRLSRARDAAASGRRMLDAVRDVGEDSHALSLLGVLAQQVGGMFDIGSAAVFIRDPADASRYVVAASHGEPGPAADEALVREAVESRTRVRGDGGIAVPVVWAGHVRAVLVVAEKRALSGEELEVVETVTRLAARALDHAAVRGELERAAQTGVEALAAAVDVRDSYTADHSDEVVELALAVGRRLGVSGIELTQLEHAARLHDVGKLGVPDHILRKPGKLDEEEWEVMRQHCGWGAELLTRVPELAAVAPAVRFHHERWDGGGYPDGLAGDDIPLASRIVSACDAYHAMTSDRPYRAALGGRAARRELAENAGKQFDPLVVEALLREVVPDALPPLSAPDSVSAHER